MKRNLSSETCNAAVKKRSNPQCFLGFAALGIMLAVLYVFSTQQAWRLHPLSGVVISLLLVGTLLGLERERHTLVEAQPRSLLSQPAVLDFAGLVGGALVTYLLSINLELGAVTASGLIGLLGALILPQQAVAIYCGSFVGMASAALLGNCAEVVLAGVIAGIVYNLATNILNGFGGKLGTIAFTATVSTGLMLGRDFIPAEVPSLPLTWQIILYATAAAVLTYWLSVNLEHGPVMGSSVVGLAGGLLLPALNPEHGSLLAVVVICASFTGMSSRSRLPNYLCVALAGVVTGIIFAVSLPVLGGAGGKLGTIAFGASIGIWAFRSLLVERRKEKCSIAGSPTNCAS